MRKKSLLLLGLIGLAGVFWYADLDLGGLYTRLETWIRSSQEWGLAGFTGATVLLFAAGAPASILCPLAGAVFGFTWGGLAFSVAGMVSTLLVFVIARWLFRDWVEQFMESRPRLKAVKMALENEGFKFLCLVRFLPVHGTIMSSILATTKARLGPFLLSSACQIPIWLLLVYLGAVAAQAAQGEASWLYLIPRMLGIGAFLGAMIYVTRVARAAVLEELEHINP